MRLIRTLIAAAPVAGFDETTLRSGPAGEKKYVHGAFTELYSAFWLGTRSLETMKEAGILPSFAGIAVSDRYKGYFQPYLGAPRREPGMRSSYPPRLRGLRRDLPGRGLAGAGQRALRGLIRAWHAAREQGLPAIPADVREPLEHEFRHAVTVGLASVPRVPGPKNSVKQQPGRELLEFCRDRRSDVLRFTDGHERLADEQHQRARRPPPENPAEDLRPPGQRRRHPGPPRHPQLHRHRPQARKERHGRPARAHARQALATPGTGILPVTPANPRHPSPP